MVGWFHDNDCLVCLLVKDEPVDKYASHELTLRNTDFKRQDCCHHFLNYDVFLELKMQSQFVVCFLVLLYNRTCHFYMYSVYCNHIIYVYQVFRLDILSSLM